MFQANAHAVFHPEGSFKLTTIERRDPEAARCSH